MADNSQPQAFIYDGLRSPFGRHGGSLSAMRADDLLATVIRTVVERTGFDKSDIEDVIAGCTNQAGEDCRNIARHAGLLAGLPVETGGLTVNRLCGSGLAATLDAARALRCGEGDLFIAAGVESMSRAPYVMSKAETPFSRSAQMFDSTIGARFPNPKIIDQFGGDTMPQTADNIAGDLGISRERSDAFAIASQKKYALAKADGFFDAEILAMDLPAKRQARPETFDQDEHPRPQTTLEKLATLKPLFDGGVVTAGN
ncbi:MAG TPA: 3-oxoadipyl-CoA thiolase, partial [Rhodospirillales bacterium]|nr:3-oxoadipyl-CoA thiolase [Rhodospirillales bacterium]